MDHSLPTCYRNQPVSDLLGNQPVSDLLGNQSVSNLLGNQSVYSVTLFLHA